MTEETPPWTIPHNWDHELIETLEWKTDVLASPTGAEQRRALRLSPRRFFEITVAMAGKVRTLFDIAVTAAGGKEWFVPLWPYVTRMTTGVAAGAGTLPVDTTGREFLPGGYALIRRDPFHYEVVTINAVEADALTLTGVLERSWERGVAVFPLRKARFVEQPVASRLTESAATSVIRFRLTGENDLPSEYYEVPNVEYYGGYPVLTMSPDERERLETAYSRYMAELDNETGKVEIVDTADRAFPAQQFRWFLHGIEQHMSFKAFLYALIGRQKAMWLPTYFRDLEVVSDIEAAEDSILVEKVNYTLFGGPNSGKRYIRIELNDGTSLYRRIVGSGVEDQDYERLPVNEPFAEPVAVADIRRISFMSLVRLDQDSIDITHKVDIKGVATSTAIFRALSDGVFRSGWGLSWGRSWGGVSMEPM